VTAGNAGSDRHPAWHYNLAANPDVTVEAGTETFKAVAVIAGEAERADLYERFAHAYPVLADYEDQPNRQIPLIVVTRR
jgi:deazaflavin-dependent oxidoreductase (nitroreductase family)